MKLESLTSDHARLLSEMIQDFEKGDRATLLSAFPDLEADLKSVQSYIKKCEKERLDWRPGPGKTSVSHYVLIDQNALCGYGKMRFPLPEDEPNIGNLEFLVPPSKRAQGYGALTLNRLLFEAVRAGMARALVVVEKRNGAAIRCVEKNRGERTEDQTEDGWARFWIRFR